MILLTGGLGYIGSHTAVELLDNGYDVVIIDNLSNSKIEVLNRIEKITGIRPKFYKVDLLEKDKLEEIYDLVRKGSFNDMITMNMSIYELCIRGFISEATALASTDNRNELQQLLRGVYHGANSATKSLKLKDEVNSEQQ